LGGIHYQNITNIDHYCDSVEAKKAPVRRALMTQEEERFIRELILQWKLGRVDKKYFQKKFGISVTERFSLIITKWKENGDLIEEGDYLVLIRDALLRVDSLLHQFFLPHHQDARYV
jgi:oxygen-independent coproporphyrinogen-3 oxidase